MLTYLQKLYQVLDHCREQNLIFAFSHWDDDKDSFIAGFVDDLTSTRVSLKLVGSEGLADDTWEGELSEIKRYHYDSEYLRGLKLFHEHRDAAVASPIVVPRYGPQRGNLYLGFLKEAQKMGRLVTISDSDHDRTCGFVKAVGSDYVEIQSIEEDSGTIDGVYVFDADDIHDLNCGTVREMKLEFLYKQRYELA